MYRYVVTGIANINVFNKNRVKVDVVCLWDYFKGDSAPHQVKTMLKFPLGHCNIRVYLRESGGARGVAAAPLADDDARDLEARGARAAAPAAQGAAHHARHER